MKVALVVAVVAGLGLGFFLGVVWTGMEVEEVVQAVRAVCPD